MKHKVWTQYLISALFAFVLSVSAIGNLITGYDLPIDSLSTVILLCGIFAFISSLLFRFRHGGKILLCIGTLSFLILWKREILWQQTQHLSFLISSHYHAVYAWPILGEAAGTEVSEPLILWGALVAIGVNWHMCRQKSILAAIFPAILPLILCLITNDRVPDSQYLYLMILCLSLLLLTQWTRHHAPAQGIRLIFQMVIPIAAALAVLFAMNPREEYVNHAGRIQKEAVSWIQSFLDTTQSVSVRSPIQASVGEKLNLKSVGPKRLVSYSVMRVNSPNDGKLYLRGRDYDRYTGTGWEASPSRNEIFTSGTTSSAKLTIVTYGVRDVLYVPYYVEEEINLKGGALENQENLQQYSYHLSRSDSANSIIPSSRYTELPDQTRLWATELLVGITDGTESESEQIQRIQSYVRDSAVYDLSTSRMDPQYTDFAKWFLEKSETGYCVHFATAATVLLRAAGIPARYVEGYMISCNAGSDVVVSNQDAHAWAEYYDADSAAWCILEATPGDDSDEETESAVTAPGAETAANESLEESEDPEPTDFHDDHTVPRNDQDETANNPHDFSSNANPSQKKQFRFPGWIKNIFKCLVVFAFLPIQAYLRIHRKHVIWHRGTPNEMAIARWKQTEITAKVLKLRYPEKLNELAQKANFSQHQIQPEELEEFDEYHLFFTSLVREKPWYQRILYLLIFAIE